MSYAYTRVDLLDDVSKDVLISLVPDIKKRWDSELHNMVKDFLNREIQFTLTDIKTYVKGNIASIDYHSNGKGFEIGIENYISGDGVKNGRGSMSIYPNENQVIFSHNDYKSHPVQHEQVGGDALSDFTLDFFNFMKKIDFDK